MTNDEIYTGITGEPRIFNNKIIHEVTNFVDDSSNIIGLKNHEIVKPYLEKYYKLVHNFHIMNKLKINSDKTQLKITCKP